MSPSRKHTLVKKIFSALVVVASVVAALGLSASSASADVPGLEIGTVGYNANGADTWVNRNREYVDVTNVSGGPVDVKGMVVQDAWAHARGDDNDRNCNTWTVNSLPGITPGAGGSLLLPAGHTIRVYSGLGRPSTFGTGDRIHAVYMNHRCGYNGHYLGNTNDTVWITLGSDSESKSWDFSNGYYLR